MYGLSGEVLPEQVEARVQVCIGLQDWVGAVPSTAWLGQFLVSEGDLAGLRREAEEIAHGENLPYKVMERRSRTSWGADSGEVVRLALFVRDSGGGALVGAAVLRFLQLLAGRAVRVGKDEEPQPLSRDEAENKAKWIVVSHYARDVEGLDPLPESEDDLAVIGHSFDVDIGSWTIMLRDIHGATYRVRFGHLDGLPTVQEIGRWASGVGPEG